MQKFAMIQLLKYQNTGHCILVKCPANTAFFFAKCCAAYSLTRVDCVWKSWLGVKLPVLLLSGNSVQRVDDEDCYWRILQVKQRRDHSSAMPCWQRNDNIHTWTFPGNFQLFVFALHDFHSVFVILTMNY